MKKQKNPSKGGAYYKASPDAEAVKVAGPGYSQTDAEPKKLEADTRAPAKPEAAAAESSETNATDLKGVRSK